MSPKWTPLTLAPKLEPDVKSECNERMAYNIKPPTQKHDKMSMVGLGTVKTLKLNCNSLCVKKPDTVCKCNSLLTTYIGELSGDQTQIIECGKCRTSYIVRTRVIDGEVKVYARVWDISRNLKNFAKVLNDDRYDFLIQFNKK